jgi:hypothetical protein
MRQDLVVDAASLLPQGADGQAVVLRRPADDRVGRQREAPHLLGLLLVVAPAQRALTGVGEAAAQGVQVLALVQLPGDASPIGFVRQIAGGVDRAARSAAAWTSTA